MNTNIVKAFKARLSKESRRVCLLAEIAGPVEAGSDAALIGGLIQQHNEQWNKTWERGFADGAPTGSVKLESEPSRQGMRLYRETTKWLGYDGFMAVTLSCRA